MVLRLFTLFLLLFGFYGCETSGSLTVGGDITASSTQSTPKASSFVTLSNPSLQEVSNFGISGIAVDITLSEDGRVAYIASGSNGLEIIDVSDPMHPFLIKSYDLDPYINRYLGTIEGNLNRPHTSLIEDNYLFTVTDEGLAIYDMRLGVDEGLLAEYSAGDSVYAFALRGEYLYLANGNWGLTILKII